MRRAAAKSGDAGTICAAAAALATRGRAAEAIAGYRQALALAPRYAKAHNNLANLLCEQGRLEEAIAHFKRAIDCAPELAEPCNNLGNVLKRKGVTAGAAQLYAQAVAINPAWPEARNNLGTALVALGRAAESIAQFREALRTNPRFIEARLNLASALLDTGAAADALTELEIACYDREASAFPLPQAGILFARCGAHAQARACFSAHAARCPGDRDIVTFLLASLGDVPAPARASSLQLTRLYDQRADAWDAGATGAEGYRGAHLTAAMLERMLGTRDRLDIADLGCGTGLIGPLIAHRARQLTGIDANERMLRHAQAKGSYHALKRADLVEFLDANVAAFDAVTCAATLIHFGDLRAAFAAVARSLRPDGAFALTLFPNADADGVAVGSLEGRAQGGVFTHGARYITRTAEAAGLAVEVMEMNVHEFDGGKPVAGLVIGLRKPGVVAEAPKQQHGEPAFA
jgi:predicted TPR repeat methyltransferase